MDIDFNKFILEREIKQTGYTLLLGTIDSTPAILKVTLPVVKQDDLSLYINKEHLSCTKNDIYETACLSLDSEVEVEVIYPALKEDIERIDTSYECLHETYDEYLSFPVSSCWIDEFMHNPRNSHYKALFENDDFVVLDKGSSDITSLRWSCVFKHSRLQSIRDLEMADLAMLENARKEIERLLNEAGAPKDKACLYFDYCGKTLYLCLEIAGVSRSFSNLYFSGRFIYFDDLVKNISLNADCYKQEIVKIVKTHI